MPTVGGYELIGRVGTGATGVVWKARDPGLGRNVALKEVPAAAAATLRTEASRLAALNDPHVVSVYGFFEEAGSAYLVEEWVEGATLSAVLAESGPLSTPQALGVCRGALLGLAHAHDMGVVHGDVSAVNVLVDTAGVSRLIDFGVGGSTPAYRSPEATTGGPLAPSSDVYAAATLVAELLGTVDPRLVPVLERARLPQPADRYPDAAAFLVALEEAARATYGTTWWTEAGMAVLVAPAVAGLVTMGVGSTGLGSAAAVAGTGKGGAVLTTKTFIAAATGAAVVAGGAVAFLLTRDDPPAPVLVGFRTDGICADLEDLVSAAAFGGDEPAQEHRFVEGRTMESLGHSNTVWTDQVTGEQGDTVTRLDGCEWSPKAEGATDSGPFTWLAVQVTTDDELIDTWKETQDVAKDDQDDVTCTDLAVAGAAAAWTCEDRSQRGGTVHFEGEGAMMSCFVLASPQDDHDVARLGNMLADVCPQALDAIAIRERPAD